MDRGKVIAAYMRGFITLKECEQILGIEASFILSMVHSLRLHDGAATWKSANHS